MARLYDAPFGQLQEFLKRLASAGFTQENMVRLTNNPGAMKVWVATLGESSVPTADYNMEIEHLFNDRRTVLMLKRASIETVGDLVDWTADDLSYIRGCGSRTIEIIEFVLDEIGMQLSERTAQEAASDPARIEGSLQDGGAVTRFWRRDKIGQLPLETFITFKTDEGPGAQLRLTSRIQDKVADLAALSEDEIRHRYSGTVGQLIIDWINENYRPWIG